MSNKYQPRNKFRVKGHISVTIQHIMTLTVPQYHQGKCITPFLHNISVLKYIFSTLFPLPLRSNQITFMENQPPVRTCQDGSYFIKHLILFHVRDNAIYTLQTKWLLLCQH